MQQKDKLYDEIKAVRRHHHDFFLPLTFYLFYRSLFEIRFNITLQLVRDDPIRVFRLQDELRMRESKRLGRLRWLVSLWLRNFRGSH
jgi:hypothetical protein